MGEVMARKITIEVEVPEGVSGEKVEEELRRQAARIVALLALESLQTREPSSREVEDLAEAIKRAAYRGRQ